MRPRFVLELGSVEVRYWLMADSCPGVNVGGGILSFVEWNWLRVSRGRRYEKVG